MTKNEMLFKLGEIKAGAAFKYEVETVRSGYSITEECENIKDVEYLLTAVDDGYYTKIGFESYIPDTSGDFIYYKDALTDIPEVDTLVSNKRDLRTTTRRIK